MFAFGGGWTHAYLLIGSLTEYIQELEMFLVLADGVLFAIVVLKDHTIKSYIETRQGRCFRQRRYFCSASCANLVNQLRFIRKLWAWIFLTASILYSWHEFRNTRVHYVFPMV